MVYNRGMMNITRTSPVSGITRTREINCTLEQLEAWTNGMPAQDAFPTLSPGEREFRMTGITESEWTELFSEEIEE